MIRCGSCLTEFDSKGLCEGCPSCGNGSELFPVIPPALQKISMKDPKDVFEKLAPHAIFISTFQEQYQSYIDTLQDGLKRFKLTLVVVKIDDLKE